MQGAAQRKVQAQLGVVGALRGAVAQDELEAENQRLRAELDTEGEEINGSITPMEEVTGEIESSSEELVEARS